MKQGINNIDALVDEVYRRKHAKKDFLAKRGGLKAVVEKDGLHLHVGSQADVKLNGVAHGQLAATLDIPKQYYDRMLEYRPDLVAHNVNSWLEKDPDKAQLVRTLDGVGRAILSDKYRIDGLEYEDLAEAALPPLLSSGVDVMSAQITDTRLYVKAVDPRVTRELAKQGAAFGDGGHTIVRVQSPAITISTSEVGLGALSVLAGVYDGFCSNLATFSERSLRKYHIGGRQELGDDISALLTDETRKKVDEGLKATITDVVRGAFDRARFDALVDKIEGTQADKIEGDVTEVVEVTRKKLNLTTDESKAVLKHLIEGASLTRFGLYNAVTRAAQDVNDYDRASQLERVGAQIIELQPNEWKELAKAA
jgi:hypothetical protein